MSQTDFNVANASGAAVRADINAHFDAMVSLSAGATAPATTFPNQWWYDTSVSQLKRRNNANTAWFSAFLLDAVFDTNGNAINESEGTAVASAATTDIWATDGNTVHITGTTTITSFGTAPRVGVWRKVILDAALTLTNGANLNLPGGANIVTAADDFAFVYAETTTLFKVLYFKADGAAVAPSALVGEVKATIDDAAPAGWFILNGDTIGNAASGATQASANNQALFLLFWNSMADAQAPVSGGRGASAQADFDADKTLTMPDARGRGLIGTGTGGGGLTDRTHGDTGGAETHTLVTTELSSHTHDPAGGSSRGDAASGFAATSAMPGASGATGSGDPHANMQPFLALNWIIKF